MPILIKDYTWKQTDEKVTVRVPLKGIHPSKADVFTFDNFIKVCLRDVIDEEKSKCLKVTDEVIFELIKLENGPWDVLEAPLTKSEMVAVKQRAIELTHKKHQEKKKKNEEKKSKIQRQAVSDQIELDTKERNHIESLKEFIKDTTMIELEEWRRVQSQNDSKKPLTIKEIFDTSSEDEGSESDSEPKEKVADCNEKLKKITEDSIKTNLVNNDKNIFDDPIDISNQKADENTRTIRYNDKSKTKSNSEIPVPRSSGKIGIKFTPRAFSTPSRESKLEEENEWLQKQAEARRRIGFVIEDLRPEEHDPVWLKDKGDSFYKVGNYLGAISAYSHGIKLNPKIPALYSNRAAAHLALNNLQRVIQDTSKALELLTPCVEMNAVSRSLCHVRRGTALCQLDSLEQGLAELEEALKLCPDNKELENDIRIVRQKLENPMTVLPTTVDRIEEEDADWEETGID